ncbi:MAG: UPF0158 family protein [Chloroflexi bacterium]|nr:UPF0158 family protein [Chloroflexota bacterium]
MNITPDFDALIKALEDRSRDTRYFFDKKIGDVLVVDAGDREGALNVAQKIKADPARFAQIPKMPAEEAIKDMEAFADSGKDKKLAERIHAIIRGGASYRDFRDLIESKPVEKERWFKFRKDRMILRINNWLKTIGK